jgi:hypothetical protein
MECVSCSICTIFGLLGVVGTLLTGFYFYLRTGTIPLRESIEDQIEQLNIQRESRRERWSEERRHLMAPPPSPPPLRRKRSRSLN